MLHKKLKFLLFASIVAFGYIAESEAAKRLRLEGCQKKAKIESQDQAEAIIQLIFSEDGGQAPQQKFWLTSNGKRHQYLLPKQLKTRGRWQGETYEFLLMHDNEENMLSLSIQDEGKIVSKISATFHSAVSAKLLQHLAESAWKSAFQTKVASPLAYFGIPQYCLDLGYSAQGSTDDPDVEFLEEKEPLEPETVSR